MNGANLIASLGSLFPGLAAPTARAQAFASRPAPHGLSRARLPAAAGAGLGAMLAAFRRRREQARVRRALAHLDDHLLRDIGLSRAEADSGFLPPFAQLEERELRALGRTGAARW